MWRLLPLSLIFIWFCSFSALALPRKYTKQKCSTAWVFVWVHVRLMYVKDIGQFQMPFLTLIFFEAQSLTGMEYTKSCRLACATMLGFFFFFWTGVGGSTQKVLFFWMHEPTPESFSGFVGTIPRDECRGLEKSYLTYGFRLQTASSLVLLNMSLLDINPHSPTKLD